MQIADWDIEIVDDGVTLLVMPDGELDVHTAPALSRAFERWTSAHKVLIVDVSRISFIDSTGLKTLVTARDHVRERLLLAGENPILDRLLELTGTAGLFTRSPS